MSRFNTNLKRVVSDYNNGLQEVINQSFFYLTEQMTDRPYFAPDFYRYLVGRYVWDPGTSGLGVASPHSNLPSATLRPDQIATQMLRMDLGHPLDPTLREQHGICQRNEYCLGYATIFQPLEPSLTHLLLAVIAARNPWQEACYAIDFVEGSDHADKKRPNCDILTGPGALTSALSSPGVAQAAGQDLRQEDCESNDKEWYKGWYKNEENASNKRPPVQLECLRQTIWMLLGNDSRGGQATGVGLVRAAVADFLFNYKMAQQYPHEFTAYELTLSAQKLDTALNPFDLAFNRDVIAYQENLRERIDDCGRRNSCTLGEDWVGFENKTFTNDAILTVRTLSANPTTVSVTTQNFLSDTQPAALSDLLASSVKEGGGNGGGSSKAAAATVGGLLQTAPLPAQLALNVLKASKSTEIQIGKSIKLNVTPHALSSASAAELDLALNVDDAAEPTFYTPTQSSQKADVSRVSNQDVTTRVRVDSLKLVDISSFSATLRRSRSRFPLLPVPGVEVPYVGSLLGIPLPAAKEYHSSTAVLSAIVVPTAADLAYGLVFVSDRIVDPEHAETCRWPGEGFDEQHRNICKIRKAESLSDLGNAPLRNFNKARVACLATGGPVPYLQDPETLDSIEPSFIVDSCTNLTFDTMFWDAY